MEDSSHVPPRFQRDAPPVATMPWSSPKQQAPPVQQQANHATQPPPMQMQAPIVAVRGRDFQKGLCRSCDTCTNTICGCCCASFYHVYLMDKALKDYEATDSILWLLLQFVTGLCVFPIHHAQNREKLRSQLGLQPQSFIHDCLLTCCCEPCATCQEGAEVNYLSQRNQLPGGR